MKDFFLCPTKLLKAKEGFGVCVSILVSEFQMHQRDRPTTVTGHTKATKISTSAWPISKFDLVDQIFGPESAKILLLFIRMTTHAPIEKQDVWKYCCAKFASRQCVNIFSLECST